jgi:hypothetical protein
MRVHTDWSTAGFGLPPAALDTSVFGGRGFLEVWWRHFGTGELQLVEDDSALLALWRQVDGSLSFVGDEDLTDYHAPLGKSPGSLLRRYLDTQPSGTPFRFDSLPEEAADALMEALGSTARRQHEAAFRLELPGDFESFLIGLSKKERHELRRKHRRFTELLGPPRLAAGTADPVGVFVQLHRLAAGTKGAFMTPERASFFRDLAELPSARIDIATGEDGRPVAAAFGFQDSGGYFLYNSAYDPAEAAASPGMVLLWLLFESAIGTGVSMFDFLKGDEAYKLRLGARPRPLFSLEGRT